LLPDFGSSMTPAVSPPEVKAKDPEEFAEKFSGNLSLYVIYGHR
jgi:conjugative transfer pilus assembly protein TraH